MILRCTDPQQAADEAEFIRWIVGEIGEADADVLVPWLHEREAPHGRYPHVLAHVVRGAANSGAPKSFLGNLVEQARKPLVQREAEMALMQAMAPHVERVRATMRRHQGDPQAYEEGLRELRVRLRETLHRLFPDKHRATIDGAMVAGTAPKPGAALLNYSVIVERLMCHEDALASTAAASHAVTDDR